MINFTWNGGRYHIQHHNDNDSRTVIALDEPQKALLKFDSNLAVFAAPSMLMVARMSSKDGMWSLIKQDGSRVNLNVPLNDFHWHNILRAEVEAAKVLLDDLAKVQQ